MDIYGYEMGKMNITMKKLYCTECKKYRKFRNPEKSYTFNKTAVLSILCTVSAIMIITTIFKEVSIEILKILGLTDNIK